MYSSSLNGMIDIDSHLDPFNDYGKSKLEMEQVSKNFNNFFKIIITRPEVHWSWSKQKFYSSN